MDELDARLRVVRGVGGGTEGGMAMVANGGGQQFQKVAIVGSRSENQLVS